MVWKHFRKQFCESLFSSSVAFLIMSVASLKGSLLSAEGTGKNQLEPGKEIMGDVPVL